MPLKEIKNQFPGRTLYSIHGQVKRIKTDPDWARDPTVFDWTAKEDEQMRKLMDDGISPLTCYQRFPGRSLGSVRRRMTKKQRDQDMVALLQEQQEPQKQRQQLFKKSPGVQSMTKLILGDNRHEGKQIAICSVQLTSRSRRMRLWTPEEDETLKKFAASHKDLSELWPKIQKAYISDGKVDGVKFVRTGLSSKKRLEQLKNDSRRRAGPWDVDEIKRLEQAIQEQIGDKPQVIADVRRDVGTISVKTAGQSKTPRLKAGQRVRWHPLIQ
ncbi:hypothetical protein BG011_002868 [Mortierella polycephala]|uniref:Myb-like domain-containing protein n=1 Tax=Mortierella polycephala TaxID=41804 RepID=A0A9P6Q268_9FUNG|nr:hypothetical protein BG011_002868 [Mortierella polycephala]